MGDNIDFGTFPVCRDTGGRDGAEIRSAYEYTLRQRGLVTGPHKIWLANPTLLRTIVATGAYFQTESSLTAAWLRVRLHPAPGEAS